MRNEDKNTRFTGQRDKKTESEDGNKLKGYEKRKETDRI